MKKEKKWLYFAIGLIVGFLISAVAFVVFAMIQSQSKSFTKTIEHIYSPENTKDTVVKYVNVARNETKDESVNKKMEQIDSLMVGDTEESFDEVDFSYREEGEAADDDVVVVDRMIAQKKIKVWCKDAEFKDVASVEGATDFFEVQQWNTPIKNRISYHFSDNVLQIKGIDLEKIEVVYFDQHYYLSHHGSYYLLENNNTFEKLGSPVVLSVQK